MEPSQRGRSGELQSVTTSLALRDRTRVECVAWLAHRDAALAAGAPLARMRRRAARARTVECSAAASTVVSAELGTAIELWRVRPTVPEPDSYGMWPKLATDFPGMEDHHTLEQARPSRIVDHSGIDPSMDQCQYRYGRRFLSCAARRHKPGPCSGRRIFRPLRRLHISRYAERVQAHPQPCCRVSCSEGWCSLA